MKYMLLIIILLSTPIKIFSQWDFKADSLFVVWGQKNYSGKQDCYAKASMTSNDTSIIVEVEVTDDKLVFNDDPLNSDHIELWFSRRNEYKEYSMDDDDIIKPDTITSYLYGNTSFLYLYKGECNLEAFKKEIISPYIAGPKENHTAQFYKKLNEDIDKYLTEARSASLKKTHVFYGLVHLGVLPKTNKAILYDKEAYDVIQKQAGIKIPDYSQFVQVESSFTENKYTTRIIIPAKGLGFSKKIGLEGISFLINVIDADKPGKQETLLSTSRSQKWGEPNTFNKVNFSTGIRVPIFPRFKIFGTSIDDRSVFSEIRNSLSDMFIYTTKGWIPIDFECPELYSDNSEHDYRLDNIQKIRFRAGKLKYKEKGLGKYLLGYLETSKGEFLVINDSVYYRTADIFKTFLLPDGSLGMISSENENIQDYMSSLFLITNNNEKDRLALYWERSRTSILFSEDIEITQREWDSDIVDLNPPAKETNGWEKLIHLDNKGRFLVVDLGNNQKVKISWDEHGRNVKYQKL
jgi:hypothetical protein